MRRLARALNRDPMILYRHAPNKAALLDGVARHEPGRAGRGAIEAIAAKPFGYRRCESCSSGSSEWPGGGFVQAAVRRLNLTEGHQIRALGYGIGDAIAFVSTSVATAPAALRATPAARSACARICRASTRNIAPAAVSEHGACCVPEGGPPAHVPAAAPAGSAPTARCAPAPQPGRNAAPRPASRSSEADAAPHPPPNPYTAHLHVLPRTCKPCRSPTCAPGLLECVTGLGRR